MPSHAGTYLLRQVMPKQLLLEEQLTFFENLLCAGHSKPPTSICNSETMPPKIERLNDVSMATQVLIVELEA